MRILKAFLLSLTLSLALSLALGSLASLPLAAQQSNTIIQTLGTNLRATGIIATPVRNAGQAFHQLSTLVTAQPAQTCAVTPRSGVAPSFVIAFEASSDNTIWQPLMTITGTTPDRSGNYTAVRQALGAWPYLRANILALDTVNCQVTVNYTGNVIGSSSGLNPVAATQTGYIQSIANVNNPTAGTTYTNGYTIPSGNLRLAFYGMQFNNDCPQPSYVNYGDCNPITSTCTSTSNLLSTSPGFIIPSGGTLQLMNSSIPYIVLKPGGTPYIWYTTTGSNCTLAMSFSFRYE